MFWWTKSREERQKEEYERILTEQRRREREEYRREQTERQAFIREAEYFKGHPLTEVILADLYKICDTRTAAARICDRYHSWPLRIGIEAGYWSHRDIIDGNPSPSILIWYSTYGYKPMQSLQCPLMAYILVEELKRHYGEQILLDYRSSDVKELRQINDLTIRFRSPSPDLSHLPSSPPPSPSLKDV